MKTIKFVIPILLLLLVLAACSKEEPTPTPQPPTEVPAAVEPTAVPETTEPAAEMPEISQPIYLWGEAADRLWVLVGYGDAANPTVV